MFKKDFNYVKYCETLTQNEHTIECCLCKNKFHYYCIEISENNFKKITHNTKSRYTCATCHSSETKIVSDPLFKLEVQFDDFNKKLESTLTELKYLKK